MDWMNKKNKKKEGGFTLVELMVVVAIIAILAAVAVPQFSSSADKAKLAKEQADIQTITSAAELYMIERNVSTAPTVQALYDAGYLAQPVKTVKGKEYTITYTPATSESASKVSVTAPAE